MQNEHSKKYERAMYLSEIAPEFKGQKKNSSPKITGQEPWVALVDMNSYFAVLEQQANPYLRNKPVGIVKDHGRTCIIAASKEAKKLGVKTGSMLFEARQLAPHIVTVAADFDKYFYNTKLLKSLFESLSPETEIFSLDEAFIDLSSCRHLYPDAQSFFDIVRQKIKAELGEWVTLSLGLGRNRLQAKLASDLAGPDNYFEITPENVDACLAEAKVEDICGIGYRLSAKLHHLQIEHPYQLNFYDDAFLKDHFGIFWGPELRRIGRGENSHLLDLIDKPPQHMKSVGRSKTLFKPTDDRQHIRQLIYNLTEEMCFKARKMKLAGKYLYLSLRDTDHRWFGGDLRLKTYLRHTDEVFNLLDTILQKISLDDIKIIKVSVQLGQLELMENISLCWLPEWNKREEVFRAVDKVNEKHGLFTLKSGTLLNFKILKPEVTGFLGDKTYQFERYAK
jgi:DNA polymerase-4